MRLRLSIGRCAVISAALFLLPACAHVSTRTAIVFPVDAAWRIALEEAVLPPLVAAGGNIIVATPNGTVRALALEDGATRWAMDGQTGTLAAMGNMVLVRSEDGRVSRRAARTGRLLWTSETKVAGRLPAAIDDERVYVAGNGLVALAAESGNERWRASIAFVASTPPVVAGARVLVGTEDGKLLCFERTRGLFAWEFGGGGGRLLSAPTVAGDSVYVVTGDRRIVHLRLGDGGRRWSWRVGADVADSPVVAGNVLLLAGFEAVLTAYNATNGHLEWRAPLPSRPLGSPMLVDGAVLVTCFESELLGFDLRTGKSLGGARLPVEMRGAPALVGRRLVVPLRDRTVTALDLAPVEPIRAP